MMRKTLPAIVWQEGKWFVAKTIGLELASQGKNKEEALENLQEAFLLLMEDEGIDVSSLPNPQKPELTHIYA